MIAASHNPPAPAMTNPLLFNIPTSLHTERLTLRCPQAGDGPLHLDAVQTSLAELRSLPTSFPWSLAEPSLDNSELYCREHHAKFIRRERLLMLMIERESGLCVGCCSLQNMDWELPQFELGIWCRSSHHGKGLAREALQAAIQLATSTLHARRLHGLIEAKNLSSRKLMDRLGFQLEGMHPGFAKAPDGTLVDYCSYAKRY